MKASTISWFWRSVLAMLLTLAAMVMSTHGQAAISTNSPPHLLQRDLDNSILRLTERLQASVTNPEGVAAEIRALAEGGFTTVDGRAMRRSDIATRALLSMGPGALPPLIAATQASQVQVRVSALDLIYQITRANESTSEFVPVFARALADASPQVRSAAVALLGRYFVILAKRGPQETHTSVADYLASALNDSDETVRLAAAAYLVRGGKASHVSQELQKAVRDRAIDEQLP